MRSNHFVSMILGIQNIGQGIVNAVEGMHRSTLRTLVRSLSKRGSWRSLKRTPAGSLAFGLTAIGGMTPIAATCPSYSATRWQRHQRCMSGVVVDPGTVGVC